MELQDKARVLEIDDIIGQILSTLREDDPIRKNWDNITNLGDLVRYYSLCRGLTQNQLACRTGLDRSFIVRLMQNEVPRSKSGRLTADRDQRYRKVAQALGINEQLFIDLASCFQPPLHRGNDEICERIRASLIPALAAAGVSFPVEDPRKMKHIEDLVRKNVKLCLTSK